MPRTWSRLQHLTGVGRFGPCDACGLPVASDNLEAPRDAWHSVDYVIRRGWLDPWWRKYHPACWEDLRRGERR
jgi:hypothetical protein